MTRWTRLIPALAVALILAACGQDASGGNMLAPEGPRMSGYGIGSNGTGGGGTNTTSTDGTAGTTSTTGGTTSSDTTTTARGGYGIGSN